MEFKTVPINISDDAPFAKDALGRKPYVENIEDLLRNISSPIVISIDAPWGCGKTTFLKMLKAQLQKDNETLFFSAWETDFAEDPLLAFIGEMNTQLDTLFSSDKTKEKWKKVKKAGSHLANRSVPVLAKALTLGLLDIDKALEGEAAKLSEVLTSDLVDSYTKDKEAIKVFKENVSGILDSIESKKIYIFIDELDRCRPTYAIEFLERIKHILDIDGLVFILAMDRKQLSHSIKAVYGDEFSSSHYLKRFIDIELTLPKPELDNFVEHLCEDFKYNSFFDARAKSSSGLRNEKNAFTQTVVFLSKKFNLALRDIEQLFSKTSLVFLSFSERQFIHPALVITLLLLKDKKPDIYDDYISEAGTPEKAIEFLCDLVARPERLHSREFTLIEAFLIAAKKDDFDDKTGNSLKQHYKNVEAPVQDDAQLRYSKHICELVNSSFARSIALKLIVDRINLMDSLTFPSAEAAEEQA